MYRHPLPDQDTPIESETQKVSPARTAHRSHKVIYEIPINSSNRASDGTESGHELTLF
jgi:hypothetical protein